MTAVLVQGLIQSIFQEIDAGGKENMSSSLLFHFFLILQHVATTMITESYILFWLIITSTNLWHMKPWELFRVTTIVLVCHVMTWVFTGMRLYRLQMLWYSCYCRIWAYEQDTNQHVLNFSYSQIERLNLNAVSIDQLLILAKYDLACSIYLYSYNSYDYRDLNYGF